MLVQILVADGRHVRELHLPRLEPLLGRDGVGRLRGLGLPEGFVPDRKSDRRLTLPLALAGSVRFLLNSLNSILRFVQ